MRRFTRFALATCATLAMCATLGATAGVALAAAPTAVTTAATNVTATTATLNGTVSPNGTDTKYFFQYGTTANYGAQTPPQGPIKGNADKAVSADVAGLKPSTNYHFRLVAVKLDGTPIPGADMTFPTPAPGATNTNALTISVNRKNVTFNQAATIRGQLTGPNNANVIVTIEENPYPYTGGFKPTGLTVGTTADGHYSFAVTPKLSTRYRVVVTDKGKPRATSPELLVRVHVRVTFNVSDSTPRRGQRVRFSGTVTPGHDGQAARIQRRTSTGHWRTVTTTKLVATTPINGVPRSKYSKRFRIRHTGTYRVRVAPGDGDHIAGNSRRRTLHTH